MADPNTWDSIHAERASLASDLQNLSPEQWSTASLCGGWTVQATLAHMTATAKMTPPGFFGKMIAAGFNFQKMTGKAIAAETGGSPAETLSRFQAEVDSTNHPPGPTDSWLGETIVHAQDIRRPLGVAHEYPMPALVQVANFYKKSNLLLGTKKRIEGLKFRTTDADWSHGEGPEISGPMASILMAMVGRKAVLDELSGDGVSELRQRE